MLFLAYWVCLSWSDCIFWFSKCRLKILLSYFLTEMLQDQPLVGLNSSDQWKWWMKMLKVPWNQDGVFLLLVASIFQRQSVPHKLWEILEFFLNNLGMSLKFCNNPQNLVLDEKQYWSNNSIIVDHSGEDCDLVQSHCTLLFM